MGKRVEQVSEAVARAVDAPDQAAAVSQQGMHMSRAGRTPPSDRNGSMEWLGRGLRQLYQGTVNEPIPDKFRELLDRLDQQEPEGRASGPAAPEPGKAGE